MFSKSFASLFIATLVARSSLAADCARQYTIKEGDICDSISASQKVSTFQLAAINNKAIDPDCSNLEIGKTICLGYPGEDCSTTYVVKPDDSCEGIASAHSLNSTVLRLNNPQINDVCDNIYIGEVLCVSQTVQVPPIPEGGVIVPVGAPASATPNATPIPTTTVTATPTSAPTPKSQSNGDDYGNNDTPVNNGSNAGGDDDDDCDDDDDTPAPPPATTKAAAPAQTPANDDDDDDDLPYCDEL